MCFQRSLRRISTYETLRHTVVLSQGGVDPPVVPSVPNGFDICFGQLGKNTTASLPCDTRVEPISGIVYGISDQQMAIVDTEFVA